MTTSTHFAVLDTETTGLSPESCRIVEIAVVRTTIDGTELGRWTTLVNPDGPAGASHIHGISDEELLDAPRFRDIVGDFVAAVDGAVLVAHNAPFDVGFLTAEMARAGFTWPDPPVRDTLKAARKLLPQLANHRLVTVAEHFGVPFDGDAHAALVDTLVCAQVHAELSALAAERRYPDPSTVRWPSLPPSGRVRARTSTATLF